MRRFVCSPVARVGGVGSFGLVSSLCRSVPALDALLPEFQQRTKSIKKPFWKHTVPSKFVVVKWSKINHWCCDKWVLWHYFYRPCKSNFLIKSADKTRYRSQAGDVSERNELTGREGCSSHSASPPGLEASLFGFRKERSGWNFVEQVLLRVLLDSMWENLPASVSVLARGRVGQG